MSASKLLALLVTLALTAGSATAGDLIKLNFDDMELWQCEKVGVTFDKNIQIWEPPKACSVYEDPYCSVVSGDRCLCVGEYVGAAGTIQFNKPMTFVAIYALSGAGPNALVPGTVVRAYDAQGRMVDETFAIPDIDAVPEAPDDQFVLVSVRGLGIMSVELYTPQTIGASWDDLYFAPSDCPADVEADGIIDVNDLTYVLLKWGTDDAAADITDDGSVGVDDFLEVITNWGLCDVTT